MKMELQNQNSSASINSFSSFLQPYLFIIFVAQILIKCTEHILTEN